MGKKVTVEYHTRRINCGCCGQKLDKPEISQTRKFHFTKDNCLEWLEQEHWKTQAEYDELNEPIREFVYETISFFATSYDEKIIIDDGEFEKVKKLVLEEVVS